MAQTNGDLATKITEKNNAPITPIVIQNKLSEWKNTYLQNLASLAGSKEEAEKIFMICMNSITKNYKLLECDFNTIKSCIIRSFQLNLYPGIFHECAYVPLRNSKTGKVEANFWVQYQGYVKLMQNAGNKSVIARVVFENDFFEYREGGSQAVYVPAVVLGKKRGKPLFAYANVCTAQGNWVIEVMSPEQIDVIKNRSRGAKSSDSPWNSQFEDDVYAMWAKCPLRRIQKWITKSSELLQAVSSDSDVDLNEVEDNSYLTKRGAITIVEPMSQPESGSADINNEV